MSMSSLSASSSLAGLPKAPSVRRQRSPACRSTRCKSPAVKKHVAELAHEIAFYGELMRKAIVIATQLKDADTADIFTEVSRGADMNLWFVEVHEQAEH